jgi:alpha-N-acetylglucosamine transferase
MKFWIHSLLLLLLFGMSLNGYFFLKFYCAVVYLDADTIVVQNIEDLFKCGKFCANLKHSERLNSGVMVVEPSEAVFNDMMSKVKTLPSYTGGKPPFFFGASFV